MFKENNNNRFINLSNFVLTKDKEDFLNLGLNYHLIFLLAESSKNRHVKTPSIFSNKLKQAVKNLKQNKDIIIRKADKASIYVILNKYGYRTK